MFFNRELLSLHRNGRFAKCWLAGTNPTAFRHYVKKKELEKINICILCDDILKILNTNSLNPKKRFSLLLASKLTYGTVCIYKQQVKFFYENVTIHSLTLRNIYTAIKRKRPILDNDNEEQPKRKRKKNVLLPLHEIEEDAELLSIEQFSSNQVLSNDLITIRETNLPQPEELEMFGPMNETEQSEFLDLIEGRKSFFDLGNDPIISNKQMTNKEEKLTRPSKENQRKSERKQKKSHSDMSKIGLAKQNSVEQPRGQNTFLFQDLSSINLNMECSGLTTSINVPNMTLQLNPEITQKVTTSSTPLGTPATAIALPIFQDVSSINPLMHSVPDIENEADNNLILDSTQFEVHCNLPISNETGFIDYSNKSVNMGHDALIVVDHHSPDIINNNKMIETEQLQNNSRIDSDQVITTSASAANLTNQVNLLKRKQGQKRKLKIDKIIYINDDQFKKQFYYYKDTLRCLRPIDDIYNKWTVKNIIFSTGNKRIISKFNNQFARNCKTNVENAYDNILRAILNQPEIDQEVDIHEIQNRIPSNVLPTFEELPQLEICVTPTEKNINENSVAPIDNNLIDDPQINLNKIRNDENINIIEVKSPEDQQIMIISENASLSAEEERIIHSVRESENIVSTGRYSYRQHYGRSGILVKLIQLWKREKENITMRDICPNDLNRKYSALSFSSVLELTEMQFVKLESNVDNLEIANIARGSKFLS